MGLLDSIKDAVSGGSGPDDMEGIDSEFGTAIDETDEPIGDEFEDVDVEEEDEEPGPWENAYRFSEYMLEPHGFTSMKDFGEKAMMHRISRSPMFRNRIQSGLQTLNMIEDAVDSVRNIKDEGGSKSWEEKANELRAANDVMSEVKTLSGEEEQLINSGFVLARDLVDAIGDRGVRSGRDVSTGIEETQEEI